jgi:hypothetical protein
MVRVPAWNGGDKAEMLVMLLRVPDNVPQQKNPGSTWEQRYVLSASSNMTRIIA